MSEAKKKKKQKGLSTKICSLGLKVKKRNEWLGFYINSNTPSTLRARLIMICSAFSSWYLPIFASIAWTSMPSIKLKAAKWSFLVKYDSKYRNIVTILEEHTHVLHFFQIIIVLSQGWEIVFSFVESIKKEYQKHLRHLLNFYVHHPRTRSNSIK